MALTIERGAKGSAVLVEPNQRSLSAEAKGELDYAGVGGGAGDAAEGRGAEAAVGLGEGWGVGDVEELGAELEVGFAGQRRAFDESEVEVAIGGAAGGVA